MPRSDREVFDYLRSAEGTTAENDFLAYALFAHHKSEWMKHCVKTKGSNPSQDEIDRWIEDISDYQFEDMRQKARQVFDVAARLYMADEIAEAKKQALNQAILSEVKAVGANVRAAGVFWKQALIALLTAILAPLILGGMIAAGYFYSLIPSPADMAKRIEGPPPASTSGYSGPALPSAPTPKQP